MTFLLRMSSDREAVGIIVSWQQHGCVVQLQLPAGLATRFRGHSPQLFLARAARQPCGYIAKHTIWAHLFSSASVQRTQLERARQLPEQQQERSSRAGAAETPL